MHIATSYLNKLIHAHGFAFGVFVSLFAFVFFAGGLVVANGQTLGPNDSKVVNLYIDGEERTMPTRAQTVEKFLSNAGVNVGEYDLVEPALNTEIQDDNFAVNVYRAKPVTIIDGDIEQRIMTPYSTPDQVAEKAGLKTYPEDNLSFVAANSFVEEQIIGQKLVIDRANSVTLSLYGAPTVPYRTHAETVGELLDEKGIVPEVGATVTPSVESQLTPSTAIFISKFGKKIVSQEESVAFAIESTPDPTKVLGQVTIISAGKKGKKQVVYEVALRDGKESGRKVIQEAIITEPVKQVQTRGTKNVVVTGDKLEWMRAAGIAESDFMYVDYIIGHESGWRPTARNASGCLGLMQACPGQKILNVCPTLDPVCQLKWSSNYAKRYGSWYGAYNFWIKNKWW